MMFQAPALFIVFKLLAHVESVSIKKAAISSLALNPLALNGLQITPASNGLISYHQGHSPVGMNPLAGMPSLQDLEVSISKTLNKNKKKISPKKLNRVNAAELHQLTTMKTNSLKKKFAELTGDDLESQSIFNRIVDQVQERYERTCLLRGKQSAIGKRDVGNTLASSCATGNILVDAKKELSLLIKSSNIRFPPFSKMSKFFAGENSKVVAQSQAAQMALNPKRVLSTLKSLPDKYWKIVVSRLGYEVNGPKDLKEHENSITELYESYCVKKHKLLKRGILEDIDAFCKPVAEALGFVEPAIHPTEIHMGPGPQVDENGHILGLGIPGEQSKFSPEEANIYSRVPVPVDSHGITGEQSKFFYETRAPEVHVEERIPVLVDKDGRILGNGDSGLSGEQSKFSPEEAMIYRVTVPVDESGVHGQQSKVEVKASAHANENQGSGLMEDQHANQKVHNVQNSHDNHFENQQIHDVHLNHDGEDDFDSLLDSILGTNDDGNIHHDGQTWFSLNANHINHHDGNDHHVNDHGMDHLGNHHDHNQDHHGKDHGIDHKGDHHDHNQDHHGKDQHHLNNDHETDHHVESGNRHHGNDHHDHKDLQQNHGSTPRNGNGFLNQVVNWLTGPVAPDSHAHQSNRRANRFNADVYVPHGNEYDEVVYDLYDQLHHNIDHHHNFDNHHFDFFHHH